MLSSEQVFLTYRNRKDDVFVSRQVSNVAVERNTLLCCSSLAYSQRNTQDCVGTKLSYGQTDRQIGR